MKKFLTAMSIILGLGLGTAQVTPAASTAKPAPAKVTAKKAEEKKIEKAAKPATPAATKLKADGTPDKRYKANKTLKKDGTPDMRYKANKK